MEDYSEKVMLSLSSARELALDSIKRAQDQYKHYFDRSSKQIAYKVGEWIFTSDFQQRRLDITGNCYTHGTGHIALLHGETQM